MKSKDATETYRQLLSDAQALQAGLISRGKLFSVARFATFAGALTFAIMAMVGSSLWWLSAFVLFTGFIILLILHLRMVEKQRFNNSLIIALNQESEAIQGNFSSFDGGPEFTDHAHSYATDLDLFGDFSLFQSINRTTFPLSKKILATSLLTPLKKFEEIVKKQNGVRELAGMPEWRLRLRAWGMVADENERELDSLFAWLKLKPFFQASGFKVATWLTPVFSATFLILLITGIISIQLFLVYLMIPLLITGIYTKTINRRHLMLSRKVELLRKYSERFSMIEREHFESDQLQQYQRSLTSGQFSASLSIARLSRITSSLDTRLNMIAGFILNYLLLWDIRQMRRLEQWQKVNSEPAPGWFNTLAEVEALASIASFAFINPGFIFPEIDETQ